MNKIIKFLYALTFICSSIFIVSCSSDELTSDQQASAFDNLKFIVHVDNSMSGTRAASNKKEWSVGDKIFMSIDDNDNNLCSLEYKGNGEWTVSKVNEQTSFTNDQGKLNAVHADKLEWSGSQVATSGDILYTKEGTYTKHGNAVVINLNMSERPIARIAIVGMDRTCWIDGLQEFTKLTSLSSMNWTTSTDAYEKQYKETYGDTCVFYGLLKGDGEGNTIINLANSDGATYSRTFSNKQISPGENIIIKGPESSESNLWTSHVPVIGIEPVNSNITMMEGTKRNIKELYRLKPSTPTNSKVKVVSSSPDIVKVDENGDIEALSRGNATITITTDDGGHKCQIDVSVQNIVDYVSMKVTGTSIFSGPWGASSSVTIEITNSSDNSIHLVSLGGATIDADLAGNSSISYTLSNRFRDITGDNFELVFTLNNKTYSKMLH